MLLLMLKLDKSNILRLKDNIDGVVEIGNDYMALVEKISLHANKLDALKVCLEKLVDEDSELITLLVGEDVVDEEVEEIESVH